MFLCCPHLLFRLLVIVGFVISSIPICMKELFWSVQLVSSSRLWSISGASVSPCIMLQRVSFPSDHTEGEEIKKLCEWWTLMIFTGVRLWVLFLFVLWLETGFATPDFVKPVACWKPVACSSDGYFIQVVQVFNFLQVVKHNGRISVKSIFEH